MIIFVIFMCNTTKDYIVICPAQYLSTVASSNKNNQAKGNQTRNYANWSELDGLGVLLIVIPYQVSHFEVCTELKGGGEGHRKTARVSTERHPKESPSHGRVRSLQGEQNAM